ncbi:M20/M25/M40 family metallo-hydrolase [Sphingomonas sp. RB56-2]|uniref:Carboxypeptidase Q n=1 Tax=Sphingomonas brevis TaxID=2908206 RepID=A0ABT0S766_9SPHN|nr:M20/M25/M40 family metallo-hydrolase [Sphingomonas brevis]MCL6740243.1 M20/M25/M40 family metallo-hydrolase [Sphingomonas brevis]
MVRSFVAAALLAAASPISAQVHASPLVDPKVASLRDLALDRDQHAWDIVEGLTTEVGPRLAGTQAEARARDWAVTRLTAMGFANVRIEPFDMPVWSRGFESAEILAPFPQRMVVAALGNSGSTGPEGVTGEIVAFDSVDALKAAPDAAVRGKIVFVDHLMPANQDGSGYGQFGAPRRQGPTIASQKGAQAIVIRSIGTDHHRNPHTGVMTFSDGAKPIPAGALSIPDAEQLVRIIKRGQPVRMRLVLQNQTIPGQSGNVIAEVPGRDPSLPPVLVGGHLDSWDQGTGAIDDGAGVAIAAAAAKRIMDAGRPLRTIRVVWFGAEEPGLFGGEAYRAKYGKQPHYALIESDFGADKIWKVDSKLGDARKAEAEAIGKALAPLGIVTGKFDEADGSDIGPMLKDGHPGVGLSQDGTRYFDIHHTPDDTLDKIDPAQLRQNVAAWTAVLAILSGGIEEPKARKRR